jgi:hypothetical protein
MHGSPPVLILSPTGIYNRVVFVSQKFFNAIGPLNPSGSGTIAIDKADPTFINLFVFGKKWDCCYNSYTNPFGLGRTSK